MLLLGGAGVMALALTGTAQTTGPCANAPTQVVSDASADQNPPHPEQLDIQSVSAGEDYRYIGAPRLVFVIKVANLNTIPANGIWRARWTYTPGGGGAATTYYVAMLSSGESVVSYEYGTVAGSSISSVGAPDEGSYASDGTITLVVARDKVGNPPDGTTLTAVSGVTQTSVGGVLFAAVDSTGTGTYTIRPQPAGCIQAPQPTPTPGPQPAGNPPRYQVHFPPAGLGSNAGEPSIGIGRPIEGHPEGRTMYVASTQTLRITFDDCASPATDLWEDVTFPTTSLVTLDPILFTDPQTGRTFVSQLLGKASSTVYSDSDGGDDGKTPGDWLQSQGSGINSGVDHQTIGGGPFAPPLTRDPNGPIYPNAVYYASQDGAVAQAAVSLDGGQTFGPAVPMYTLAQCAGIHGHIKVAPDGTVYVPNKSCGTEQAAVVSENNGATWEVRKVPGSTAVAGIIDPAVGIGANNTVYFGGKGADGLPFTAVSKDRGKTWTDFQKLGINLGIKNATFPQMTAGDDDRAAMTFLGSTTGGNYQATISTPNGGGFKGDWHLYIATTYDSGFSWHVVNATPGDPVQRNSICNNGTTCLNTPDDRNLLDFNDVQIDNEGRVQAAFADGCISANCISGVDANNDGYKDNDYTSRATLARQVGGRRLLAAFDPPEPSVPAAPRVTSVSRDLDYVVRVRWLAPDDGGSEITGYKVFRKVGEDGAYTLIAMPGPTQRVFADPSATGDTEFFYSVKAMNSQGDSPSCGDFPIGFGSGDPCAPPGVTILTDKAGDLLVATGETTYPGYDLRGLSVGEPIIGAASDKIVFTVKVENLTTVPPNTRWPVQFRVPGDAAGLGRFVDMRSNAAGAVEFRYGTFAITAGAYSNPTNVLGAADAESAYTPDGNIRIVVSRSKIGNPPVGSKLEGFLVRVRIGEPNATGTNPTPDNMNDDTLPAGSYSVIGNLFCQPNTPPLAAIAANPRTGPAPLTVVLDASASSDADASDTIVSYTFNFGDGTRRVTQTTPIIEHTYQHGGAFQATVVVQDSRELESQNAAGVVIEVDGPAASPTPTPNPSASPSPSVSPGPSPSPSPSVSPGPSASPDPSASPSPGTSPSPSASPSPGTSPSPSPSVSPTPDPSKLVNISSRLRVQTDDNVLIGGFITTGSDPKRVLLRGIGPSLKVDGTPIPGRLEDPVLELFDENGAPITSNDNWQDSPDRADIETSGLAPEDEREAVIARILNPGVYTAVVRGSGNSTGIALVEAYDRSPGGDGELGNISTRGFVESGDNVLIGGFIVGARPAGTRVLVRAIGPSLKSELPNAMNDPRVELFDANGTSMGSNDNWEDSADRDEIESTGLQPTDQAESAVIADVVPALYTAIVSGVENATGVALVEIYNIK